MEFSTSDRDNDEWSRNNCAAYYGGGGNWWKDCAQNNINGEYGGKGDEFMCWTEYDFDYVRSLKTFDFNVQINCLKHSLLYFKLSLIFYTFKVLIKVFGSSLLTV